MSHYPLGNAALAAGHFDGTDSGVKGGYLRVVVGEELAPVWSSGGPTVAGWPTLWRLSVSYLRFGWASGGPDPTKGPEALPAATLTAQVEVDLAAVLVEAAVDGEALDVWATFSLIRTSILALLGAPPVGEE